jgi:hypothetical protein
MQTVHKSTSGARFLEGHIYKMSGSRDPYDEDAPQFDCLSPAMDDNGQFSIVDCWITDSMGNVHPGYNVSPVPVSVDNIGDEVTQ